jgi:hypothetical protein
VTSTGSRRKGLDPDTLAALEDQREFLLRSLEDLEREHDAGDLDDDDYETLRDDYTGRAAEVLKAIDAQRDAMAAARRPRDRRRTALVLVGVLVFAVAAGALVAASLGARGEGDTASGGIGVRESPSQRAQQCQTLIDQTGQSPSEALSCFRSVLDDDARNVVAMTWSAWQLELTLPRLDPSSPEAAATAVSVEQLLDQAIELNPGYSYARAFRAVVAYRHGDPEAAKAFLAEFEANDPSSDAKAAIGQLGLAASIDQALAELDAPDTNAGSTTTTPS